MRMSSTAAVAPPPRTTIARATQIHIEEPAGSGGVTPESTVTAASTVNFVVASPLSERMVSVCSPSASVAR